MDGDVYLTGSHHPLSKMAPMSDPSWSIQLQSNRRNLNNSDINIGWYWVRPTEAAHELFSRSYAMWNRTGKWDQGIVDTIRSEMVSEGKLAFPASIVLSLSDYINSGCYPEWFKIYPNVTLIDEMLSEAVLIHFAGTRGKTKHFMAKHLGLWGDLDGYYTGEIPLLQPVNLSGTRDQLLWQLDLAVYLAKSSGRTFVFPMTVNLTEGPTPPLDGSRPAVALVDVDRFDALVPWVEGTYLHNRARYTHAKPRERTISVDTTDPPGNWTDELVRRCRSPADDMVKIDFGKVDGSKLIKLGGVEKIIREMNLRPCGESRHCWWGEKGPRLGC